MHDQFKADLIAAKLTEQVEPNPRLIIIQERGAPARAAATQLILNGVPLHGCVRYSIDQHFSRPCEVSLTLTGVTVELHTKYD